MFFSWICLKFYIYFVEFYSPRSLLMRYSWWIVSSKYGRTDERVGISLDFEFDNCFKEDSPTSPTREVTKPALVSVSFILSMSLTTPHKTVLQIQFFIFSVHWASLFGTILRRQHIWGKWNIWVSSNMSYKSSSENKWKLTESTERVFVKTFERLSSTSIFVAINESSDNW